MVRYLRYLITFILIFHCTLSSLQAAGDEANVWADFIEWLNKQPPVHWEALIPEYKSRIIATGLSESQADQYISIIRLLAKEKRLELTAIVFNRTYVTNSENFVKEPNAFLVRMVSDLKPGRALDIGMGQGRNAIFLLEKGWEVMGFDIAEEGLRLAQEKANKIGQKITTIRATYEDFDYGTNQWDLVIMTYSWAPMDKPEYIQRIYESLKAGGIVLVEDNTGSLGRKIAGDNFLLNWFENFRIIHYEALGSGSEWGNPKDLVYRLLAQKP